MRRMRRKRCSNKEFEIQRKRRKEDVNDNKEYRGDRV